MSQKNSNNAGINKTWKSSTKRGNQRSSQDYLAGIKNRNRSIIAEAITFIENENISDQKKFDFLGALSIPDKTLRIAISGSPGVGKSTFINSLGMYLINQGHRVAVLAVDPSSTITKGSILGDKTRMYELTNAEEGFVRPSPSRAVMGGVTGYTKEAIAICEAAGYDIILVETVGVGQTETEVKQLVDFFALLLLPGAGDELQGIKKGIVEIADLFIINKADGDRISLAKESKRYYQNALHLGTTSDAPKSVLSCSALDNQNIDLVWEDILTLKNRRQNLEGFNAFRLKQEMLWEEKTKQKIYQKSSAELFDKLKHNNENQENPYLKLSRYADQVKTFFNQFKKD